MGNTTRIDLDNGKYSFIIRADGTIATVLRYGEQWPAAEDLKHSKVVLSMLDEIRECREKHTTPQQLKIEATWEQLYEAMKLNALELSNQLAAAEERNQTVRNLTLEEAAKIAEGWPAGSLYHPTIAEAIRAMKGQR